VRWGAWRLELRVRCGAASGAQSTPPTSLSTFLARGTFDYTVEFTAAAPRKRRRLTSGGTEGGAHAEVAAEVAVGVAAAAATLTITLAPALAQGASAEEKARWKAWRKVIPPQLVAALPLARVESASATATAAERTGRADGSAAAAPGCCSVAVPWPTAASGDSTRLMLDVRATFVVKE